MTSDNVKHSESARYACRNLFLLKILAIGKQKPSISAEEGLGQAPNDFFESLNLRRTTGSPPAIIEHPGMPSDTLYWPEYKCFMRFISVQGLLTVIFRHLHHQLAHCFHLSFENLTKRRVSTSDCPAADPDIAPTRPRIRCEFASHFGFFIGRKTSPSPA